MRRILAWVGIVVLLGIFLAAAVPRQALAQQGSQAPGETPAKVEPGLLGAELDDLSEASIKALGLSQKHALLVVLPLPGGPAERAGLRSGDVLLDLEGVAVGTLGDFVKAIQELGAGRAISLGILRGGERLDVPATLGSMEEARRAPPGARATMLGYVGLNLRDLSEQSVKALNLKQTSALLVRQALPNSPADQAGLKAADIILALDGVPVTTAQLFDAAIRQRAPGQEIRLDILRDRAPLAVSVLVGVDSSAAESVNVEERIDRAIQIHHALLDKLDRHTFPLDWAITQRDLALAYAFPTERNRANNQDKAIEHLEAALGVFTRDEMPHEWATAQNQLGLIYGSRIRGDRSDNQEKAIAALESALALWQEPGEDRASAQSNLGLVYLDRLRGDYADNVEKAISALRASMEQPESPYEWAPTRIALASAYRRRPRGNKADNQEEALAIVSSAQEVITRESSPFHWALIQQELAHLYSERINGDRAENIEKVIEHLQNTLSFYSETAWPVLRAETLASLGDAYRDRIRGEHADNLKQAVAAYSAALKVQTTATDPRHHLSTALDLGSTLSRSGEWSRAGQAYAGARESFLALFGQGLNEVVAQSLLSQAGPLFAEASFAAVRSGEFAKAFALAVEGRARLMAVALKLQTLALPSDKRRRLDELRAEIRVADRTVEVAQGTERAAAVEKLVGLRHELLGLVKDADAAEAAKRGSALEQARALARKGGAVVVPVVTGVGATILIVTSGSDPAGLNPIDLPDVTTAKLDALVRGNGKTGGWLGAYNINYIEADAERERRWPEWIAAVDNLGPELWRLIGGKLDATLKEAGVRPGARIVWLPTGALGILPLGLAQDPKSGRRLADGYEIVYAPSLEALTSARQQIAKVATGATRGAATLGLVVNPTGDLPGTEKEGRLVASHFRAVARTVRARAEASPEKVLAALRGRSYWHFASHGTFSWEDARKSGLYLAGPEVLTVGRLLETDGLGRPRLVVLSACETGLYDIKGNPDEFIGLPGTFTALGAAGVLGTLWPVNDAATALLIAKFYDLHLGQWLAPPTALRRSQLWLRQATNRDLQVYARIAAKQGRLESRHLSEIEAELSEEGLARSRHAALVEWSAPELARAPGKAASGQADRFARPYAHPYFWAGFIYTGL
jgi:CHAT domain-containing protein/tetratricopeptide (TPR) repeat protein